MTSKCWMFCAWLLYLTAEVIIFGMEPLNLDTTLSLSSRIEERLPVLIEHVRQELDRLVSIHQSGEND
jgi:hypothetical protein